MKPDQLLFLSHLEGAAFQAGVDAEKWGLLGNPGEISWPNPIFWVAAAASIVPAGKIFLRFDMDQYPASAPTACPWDMERNTRLSPQSYPKIPGTFQRVFRTDWQNGEALYCPCDRIAMSGHEAWKETYPYWWWTPSFTIVKYLEFVHLCLNPYEESSS